MPLRLSVVLDNYNYAAHVAEAIASVRAQTRPADELIVVDDGSTDASLDVLRPLCEGRADTRLISQANAGQLAALIAGTAAATGDIVCYLDADDRWQPDYLARLAEHYAAAPTLDFIASNLRHFGARDGLWRPATEDRDHGLSVLATRFAGAWIGAPTSALSMRRAVAQAALAVPPALWPDWRTRADDVLVVGSSLAGATKRTLAAAAVDYRVHDCNAWIGRAAPDALARARHDGRMRRLLAHFSAVHGLDETARLAIKHEFRTIPAPSRDDWQRACRIAWEAPARLGRRLELVLGLTRDQLRAARSAR